MNIKKRKLIIDTDPGIDDAVALAAALFSDELDVKLITTIAGNVDLEKVTNNVLKLLKFYNKNILVAAGSREPLLEKYEDASAVHGASGMDGFDFPEPTKELLLSEHAVVAMRKVIMESEDPITIVPIGPMTNIALLLKLYPEVKKNIQEIVFMGGSFGRGNKGVLAEYNIAVDPEAAQIVMQSGLKISMIGLEMGNKAIFQRSETDEMAKLNKVGQMIAGMYRKYRSTSLENGFAMYDVCAIAYILKPEIYDIKNCYVEIELNKGLARGCSVVDIKGYLKKEPNVNVCMDINVEAFKNWFLNLLKKCN